MLYYFSRLKDKFIQCVGTRTCGEVPDCLHKALYYPPDLLHAEFLLHRMFKTTPVVGKDLAAFSKDDIKSLSYDHLLVLHKFYNCQLYIKPSILVFHEVLRRDATLWRLPKRHGVKRFLFAHILFAGLRDKPTMNPRLYKAILALLFAITNKSKSNTQAQLVQGGSAVIIGGAADHGDLAKISQERDIVCGINRLESYDILCDIAYLRGEALMDIERKNDFDQFRSVPTFISAKLPLMVKKFPKGRAALTTNIDLATSYGTLNAAPTICLDLIRCGARHIKLVCVDFNLGGWGANYKPVHSTLVNKSLIFGQHPAPLQFLIIKSLANYYDVSLAPNPYIRLDHSYRYFIRMFARQCKAFGEDA